MADLYRILGMISRGEKHAAGVELGRLLKSEPQNIQAWSLMALAQDDPAKKAQCYQHILQIDPHNSIAREQLDALQVAPPAPEPNPEAAESDQTPPPADSAISAPPPQAPLLLECPACSHLLTASARFCPNCGSPVRLDLPAAQPPQTPQTPQEPAAVEPAPPPAPQISTAPVIAADIPDPDHAAPLIEPVLPPDDSIPSAPIPPEAIPPVADSIAPDEQTETQPTAETSKPEKARRPGILVLTSAAGAGCLTWIAAMAAITYLMSTFNLSSQSWIYAFSLLGFVAGFFVAKNALLRRKKGSAAPVSGEAQPVVINEAEVRLLLKAGEVHTLFGGDLTLSIEKIKFGRGRLPESVDFRLQSPGGSRQKFKKALPGARLQYASRHPYLIDIARAPSPIQALAMRIRRTR